MMQRLNSNVVNAIHWLVKMKHKANEKRLMDMKIDMKIENGN